MMKRWKQSFALALIMIIMTGSMSVAIPIQPSSSDELDYLDFVLGVIDKYYIEEVDKDELIEGAYNGIFEKLDRYSTYYTKEAYERYNEDAGGSFGGIGISVIKDDESDYIKVVAPIEGTPGDRAGIVSNDLIIAVNGNSIKGYTLEDAVKVMRGNVGSKIRLTIKRTGVLEPLDFDITREVIKVTPVGVKIREDGIAVLRLKSFNENSAADVKTALVDIMNNESVEGLIIDLRNNPGGRLDQVVEIADFFLDVDDPIVQIDYRAYADNIYTAQADADVDLPMAVLINNGSASASEILAGALQDNGVATVVGVKSFGKGTVQSVTDLSEGSGMKLTIAEYLTAAGNKVNGQGITPDIEIENIYNVGDKTNLDFAPMIEQKDHKAGEMGLNVYGAQQRLFYLGYESPLTGKMDEKTVASLKAYQKDAKLTVNGQLDAVTRSGLYASIETPANERVDKQMEAAADIVKQNMK